MKAASRRKYDHMIGVFVSKKTYAAIKRAARKDRRTISHVVREVLDAAWFKTSTPKGQKEK